MECGVRYCRLGYSMGGMIGVCEYCSDLFHAVLRHVEGAGGSHLPIIVRPDPEAVCGRSLGEPDDSRRRRLTAGDYGFLPWRWGGVVPEQDTPANLV